MPATGSKTYRPLNLSIRLRADGFSFFVCDAQAASLVRGEHFKLEEGTTLAERLTRELARTEYNNRQIEQVFVLVGGPVTHVPLEEFRRDEAATMYNFVVSTPEGVKQHVGYNILPQLEVVELFAIADDVEEAIIRFHPTARLFAANAMVLERLCTGNNSSSADISTELYAYQPSDNQLTIVACRNDKKVTTLQMANTYDIAGADDAVYFILSVWQMFNMIQTTDGITLLGQKSELMNEILKRLKEYVIHVHHLLPNDFFPNMPLAREREVPLDLMALLLNRL